MVKRKYSYYDFDRKRMKQLPKALDMKLENYLESWENGFFESRNGALNKQGIDMPYKNNGKWEWWEGDHGIYGFRKTALDTRKTKNAKSKKPKNKKHYRKARNYKELTTPKVPDKIAQWRWERDQHAEMMWERGQSYYATCKGCSYPLSYRHMDNSDMALCYDCAKGLRDEAFVNEMLGEKVE